MKETIMVIELLAMIKKARTEVDDLFKKYIDTDTATGRSMVTIANNYTNYTINGAPVDQVKNTIEKLDEKLNNSIHTLEKLLLIKEQVNATSKIVVPDIEEEGCSMKISIAQCLVLKSDQVKNYKIGYLEKLRSDYVEALKALSLQQESVMANDKVDRYVIAKMNALHINSGEESSNATYQKFADEYRVANKMEIVDPLDIRGTIDDKIAKVRDFYDTLDLKLLQFNATTKIWIDLEAASDDYLWGYAV